MISVNFINKNIHVRQFQISKQDTEQNLRSFAFLTAEEVYTRLSVTQVGLTGEEVEERQNKFGKNIITVGNTNTVLHRLREATINPFNVILLLTAIITYFTDVVASVKPDYLTVIIILGLVLLSSLIAFSQSQRSNAAAEKLSKMISNKADVWRDGKLLQIPMDDVVPGDIIRLSAGDMLPADVRFLATKDAFIAQAALTGESNPVEKFSNIKNNLGHGLTD